MITLELMEKLFPTRGLNPKKFNLVRDRAALVEAMNRILPKYGIDNYLRLCAFLGNCGIETDYFRTTIEYASGDAYDTRTSLGNTPERDGDGRKYKGRGLTQTTGKYNYEQLTKAVGKEVGIDFVKNPEKLAEIEIAVLSACVFWKDHNLNSYADRGEFKQLSGIVNRGNPKLLPLHWSKRNMLYSECKRRVPKNISFQVSGTVEPPKPAPAKEPDANPTPSPDPNSAAAVPPASASLKDLATKYARHCPTDSVKNVCGVAAARVGASASGLWALGLTGKIFLVCVCLAAVGVIGWTLYYYYPRIIGWIQTIADSYLGSET